MGVDHLAADTYLAKKVFYHDLRQFWKGSSGIKPEKPNLAEDNLPLAPNELQI